MTQPQEEPIFIDLPSENCEEEVNWHKFAMLSSAFPSQISSKILYIGNISDCWELLQMKIKEVQEELGADYKIIAETMTIGRIYFLEMCKKSINPKQNDELRKKLKGLIGELKDSWFQQLDYSTKEILSSNLFEMVIRKHKLFQDSSIRKQIIKIAYELNFTEPNKQKILTYLWLVLQSLRFNLLLKVQNAHQQIQAYAVLLIICICYPSLTLLMFSPISTKGTVLQLMFLQNGAMLVNERLKNMEKKEFEIMKKALYSKNEQV